MVVVNEGKNRIRDLIDADVSGGEVGTGTTPASVSDTDTETAVASTLNTVTTSVADKQVTIDYNLGASQGNGSAVTEHTLFMNSDADLLARFVFSSLTKSSDEQWQFTTTVKVV